MLMMLCNQIKNYKKTLSSEEAREEIKKNTESQFDPELDNISLQITNL